MRNIELTRAEAEKLYEETWEKVREYGAQMSERVAALAPRDHAHDSKWQKLERLRLDAISAARRIKESGVIPWLENESLGSYDSHLEIWAARIMLKSFDINRRGTNDEHDPMITVTSQSRQHIQHTLLDRESAEALRDQLIDELEKWDEK